MMTDLGVSYEDIRQVVYKAWDKDYMKKFLHFLSLVSQNGFISEKEANISLDDIVGEVCEDIGFYKLLLDSLTSHDRRKGEPLYSTINDTIAEKLLDEHNEGKEFLEAFSPNRGPRTWYGMGEWTAAFQLVTQLYYQYGIERGVPINIYIGGGSGKLTSMVTEACKVLQDLNILKNPIRVWCVQPTINQPLVQGYNEQVLPKLQQGLTYDDIKKNLTRVTGENPQGTIVEEVAIRNPGSFLHTMKSLAHPNSSERKEWKAVRGGAIAIDDRKTLDGTIELALKEGKTPQFVGGMAYQGFRQAIAQNPGLRNEIHVVYLTGGGKGKMRQTLEQMARNELWGRREELLKIAPLF